MTNGRPPQFKESVIPSMVTVITAVFVAGTLWAKIASNAASMRATMEEIRAEQREMAKTLQDLKSKP